MRQVCFGIDIGGTTVKLGLVNREGDLLAVTVQLLWQGTGLSATVRLEE